MINKNARKSYRQHLLISAVTLCFLTFYTCEKVEAQSFLWEDFVERLSTDDRIESEERADILEEWEEWHRHPLNINTTTKEELERLPFLTAGQVEAILAYIYRYGPLKTLGELQLIRELDFESRNCLWLFYRALPVEKEKAKLHVKNLLKSGKNSLMTKIDIPLYQRDGYKSYTDEELLKNPNRKYLGNALYHSLRYRYAYGKRVFWGFAVEKDGGEPFGSYGNWSYDAFSFHFLLHDVGRLKTLALGDYKLSFGEGVVMNTGFSFGKAAFGTFSPLRGIRRHSSTDEYNYLRGAAATLRFGHTDVSVFFSRRKLDATPAGNDSVSTLRTDGYHRTLSEVARKHNLTALLTGGNLTWRYGCYRVGATGYHLRYDKCFVTGSALYRKFYPHGKHFSVVGADYGYQGYRLSLAGETAYSDNRRGWATLNRAGYRINERYRLMLLQRFYSYKYYSFLGSAFSEESRLCNESGVYAAFESSPLDGLEITAYADFFYSPWPRYTLSHSSAGQEGGLQLRWSWSRKANLLFRYRVKSKEKFDCRHLSQWLKGQLTVQPANQLDCQTVFLFHTQTGAADRRSRGYGCGQTLKRRWAADKIRTAVSVAYFHTDDYDSRLYFYEPGLPYTFYYPAYYGRCLRAALLVQGKWNGWMLAAKYGLTHFFDRDEIGSGTQRISCASKNDISVQLNYDF